MVFMAIKALSRLGFVEMGWNGAQVFVRLFNVAVLVIVTCSFCFAGGLVGCVKGAITGQTTEMGFLHGARIGAISGAVVAIELLDSLLLVRCFKSKVALFYSLLINRELFKEWLSSAHGVCAYQWQSGMLDSYYGEFSDVFDIFDISESKGMSMELIKKLPVFHFCHVKLTDSADEICCTICLENFKEEECGRRLTNCRHFFHLACIDAWLVKHGSSCPICRQEA